MKVKVYPVISVNSDGTEENTQVKFEKVCNTEEEAKLLVKDFKGEFTAVFYTHITITI
ncbi:hypothetical protein [Lysinibacillus fusiformis]|uniref:hypothetical protein n=1 Tax=Lysinibacillus fusiformis TaxID=28031 RepID=UPI00263BD8B7|nr:hypothetical protein [Lysinibacillus fusiformis]MDC6267230.1 hypothetical protein [Lysinibacillus sphaericus]MDN4968336.1 hypothetical protein [Lysinibacillus fusiformis]MDN4968510.1 hypothetical protein [Lysinibacillus fusiformis]